MQAPKDSKAYKNSINGVGKMVHRYSFTQVKPPELSLKIPCCSLLFFKENVLKQPQSLTLQRVQETVSSVKIFCCTHGFYLMSLFGEK
jgi:hypothetical protein